MPSFQKSAVFLNIVQKAFDPPPPPPPPPFIWTFVLFCGGCFLNAFLSIENGSNIIFLLHQISMPTTLKKGIVHPLGLFKCLPANEDRAVQLHHSVRELLRPGLHQKLKIWGWVRVPLCHFWKKGLKKYLQAYTWAWKVQNQLKCTQLDPDTAESWGGN